MLNGHDHLYARYRPLDPSGKYDPKNGIREFVVGTGGETLDPVVTTTVTSGSGETNMEDPSGNVNFNAENLEAGTGQFWGVMRLTLNQNGYAWDFESASEGSRTANRTGYVQRQRLRHLPRSSQPVLATASTSPRLTTPCFCTHSPFVRNREGGNFLCFHLSSCPQAGGHPHRRLPSGEIAGHPVEVALGSV